jgi:undecaprenyl-diphosphatase
LLNPVTLRDAVKRIRGTGLHPLVALLFISSLLLALYITFEMMEGEGAGPDRAILLALRKADDLAVPVGPQWLLQSAIDISAMGGFTIVWLFTVVVSAFLALVRSWRALFVFLLSVGGASVLGTVLKLSIHRDRPSVVPHLVEVSTSSFPSGHAMISAATYLTAGALLAYSQPSRMVRLFIHGVAIAVTLSIGLSRVYLGAHWPSDVLAGWSFGTAWALMFCLIARRGERPTERPPTG